MPLYSSTALDSLTNDEWAALNSPTAVRRFMSIVPNSSDVLGTGVVATVTTGGYAGIIEVTYTGGTGFLSGSMTIPPEQAYSKDITIWIGTTPASNDIGIFR